MSRREFVIVLRAEGSADEAETCRRLRAALKVLLRSFRLRCLSIQPAAEPTMQDTVAHAPAALRDQCIDQRRDAA
ncbi:MAG TPA: hypothetical protein VHY20_15220 [Pirellulales bacterium]|jgi:hypothetical protein|nr:hypothetical protein [Pirellulales bacterium]